MSISVVSLASNRQRDQIEIGRELPTLIQSEKPSTTQFLIDASDKISGNAGQFYVDMGYCLPKARYLTLKKVILPKINNVNTINRTISVKTFPAGAVITFDLLIGLYNTSSFANMITTTFNSAFVLAGVLNNITCTFDSRTRTFSITDVNGFPFFIVDTSPFITYGINLAPFESEPVANVPSKSTIYSATAGMLYTRYLSISSEALTQWSVGSSITTNAREPPSIFGIVDICELYTASDFDIIAPYNGVYRSLDVYGNKMSMMNSSRIIPQQIDISITDGFGLDISQILSLGSPYPNEKLSIVLLFEVQY